MAGPEPSPYGEQHCSMLRLLGDHLNMLGGLLKRYGSAQDFEVAARLQRDLRSMATARDSPLGEGYVVPGASVDRSKWKPLEICVGPWDLPFDGVRNSVHANDALRTYAAGFQPMPVPVGFARKSREEKDDYRPMKLRESPEVSEDYKPMKLGFARDSCDASEDYNPVKLGYARGSAMSNGHSPDVGLASSTTPWACSENEEKLAFKHNSVHVAMGEALSLRESHSKKRSVATKHDPNTRHTMVQNPLHLIAEEHKAKVKEHKRKSEADDQESEISMRARRRVCTSSTGDIGVAAMILLNAAILGVQADIQWDKWEYIEVFFTLFFTAEMFAKIFFQGCRYYWRGPDCYWNWFDGTIVIIALSDLLYSQVVARVMTGKKTGMNIDDIMFVKMIRLCRLARMVRLLRFKMFAQLKMMIQGVAAGLQVLFWAIVLLFFFIYVIAIIMQKSVKDIQDPRLAEPFSRVPWAMFTVFLCFTDGCTAHDGTPLQTHLYAYWGAKFMIPYVLTFLFVTIGLFNLIMAIFVDNVMENTIQRKRTERAAFAEAQEKELRKLLLDVCTEKGYRRKPEETQSRSLHSLSGAAGTGIEKLSDLMGLKLSKKRTQMPAEEDNIVLNRDAFADIFECDQMEVLMDSLEISTCDRSSLFDILDADMSGELELDEVVVGLMSLRGPAEKTDSVGTLLCVRVIQQILRGFEEEVCHAHDQIYENLISMESKIDELRA